MIPSTILLKEIKNKALSGFIENEDILKKKFSDLDHHKKSYILQSDFNSCFGIFNLISVKTDELLSKLKSSMILNKLSNV